MSLKNKLNRFKSHLTKEATAETGKLSAPSIDVPFLSLWEDLQCKPYSHEGDYAISREVSYPLSQFHGKYSFELIHDVVEQWNRMASDHPLSSAGLSAEDLLFFDTETTGLRGGAGNTIFLIGYSRIIQDRVVVRQFFLPGPESEVAFYQGFLNEAKELKHLVTYNGKAFDWPQVKTRHTLLRDLLPQLPAFGHYDLLHGARRLWKSQLDSCRLSIVEQEILGIQRNDDTPGYLAPLLYFDFLRDKNPLTVKGVLQHNETDVLSLISLYIHLSLLLQDRTSLPGNCQEHYQLGRWFEHVGDIKQAMKFYTKAIKGGHITSFHAKISLAGLYKKQKEWEQAIQIWEDAAHHESSIQQEAFIELSKAYEHHKKDYEKALFYADRAHECWKSRQKLMRHRKSSNEQQEFLKRIARLEKKCFFL